MLFPDNIENALITIYGDTPQSDIAKSITSFIPDRQIRILTPADTENLEQAARNSSLIFIGLKDREDKNLRLGLRLKDNRFVVADVVGFCLEDIGMSSMEIMGQGFHNCIGVKDTKTPEYKNFLIQKIITGNRRLNSIIQEEEYRRVCDALSCAPASMIIFDQDKRAVFVSDHYYRAYPKIAPRLTRGLSVYDAFAMMMKEEGLSEKDERFFRLQNFWHNLAGSIEFTLDSGTAYRLKAVHLPSQRGTVIMGQNISDYQNRHNKLEEISDNLQQELNKLNENSETIQNTVKSVVAEFEKPLDQVTAKVKGLKKEAADKAEFKEIEVSLKELQQLYKQAKKLSQSL